MKEVLRKILSWFFVIAIGALVGFSIMRTMEKYNEYSEEWETSPETKTLDVVSFSNHDDHFHIEGSDGKIYTTDTIYFEPDQTSMILKLTKKEKISRFKFYLAFATWSRSAYDIYSVKFIEGGR